MPREWCTRGRLACRRPPGAPVKPPALCAILRTKAFGSHPADLASPALVSRYAFYQQAGALLLQGGRFVKQLPRMRRSLGF